MKIKLEKINKNLMILAIASLLFRGGEFIPKPFECILVVITILFFIDIIKNKRIKEFYNLIPKKIVIVICSLILSVLIGWGITIFIKKISLNIDMIKEFFRLLIAIWTFLLIMFFTHIDKTYIKKYLYALLVPIIYTIFLIFPNLAEYFNLLVAGRFNGFTNNLNTTSKILLIPAIYFITNSLFEIKNIKLKYFYIFISSSILALLFWVGSRGAIVSLFIGIIIYIIFLFSNFNWKKLFNNGVILFVILLLGFIITPYSGKQIFFNRILNKDSIQQNYSELKQQSIINILAKSIIKNQVNNNESEIPESRLEIWPFYIKKALMNPLGIGPAFSTYTSVYVSIFDTYENIGSHNSYLEILLWGGVLGLFSFIYIFYYVFKNLINKMKISLTPDLIILITSMLAFSIVIMFDDSSKTFWLWIIMALSLSYKHEITN